MGFGIWDWDGNGIWDWDGIWDWGGIMTNGMGWDGMGFNMGGKYSCAGDSLLLANRQLMPERTWVLSEKILTMHCGGAVQSAERTA